MPRPRPSPGEIATKYDDVYARSLAASDDELLMSLEKLFANYGVLDPLRDRDSERLTIALRMLDFEHLTGKLVLDYGCGSAKAAVVFAFAGGLSLKPTTADLQQKERRQSGEGSAMGRASHG